MRNSGMETIDSVEKSRSFLRSGGGEERSWMDEYKRGIAQRKTRGESWKLDLKATRCSIYPFRYDTSSRIIARENFERRRPTNAAKFRNGRNPGNRSSSGRDSRQLSLSLSSIALELETRKFDTSTLCSASLLLLPPRLQYTVSFVRFFTHFELHILLVDTVTFNPNLWFAGELLVEDFSRVWMDARFSGKLSLHHAATYIVLAYPIPKPAF